MNRVFWLCPHYTTVRPPRLYHVTIILQVVCSDIIGTSCSPYYRRIYYLGSLTLL